MQIPELAIIIPCYNEELCIESTSNKLIELINKLVQKNKIKSSSFIYFVDDGSTDSTWEKIVKMNERNNLIKGGRFIRNFGNQKALIAGLERVHALGCDCAVSIDADLQQDENAIENFIDEYSKGYDIVLGIRKNRSAETLLKKIPAILFYKIMNLLGAKITMNHSEYRLVSKKALDIMKMYPEKQLFLRGFFQDLGLHTTTVMYSQKPRLLGNSKFNFMTLMGLALNGITSFSIVPLRIIACLGFLMSFIAFIVGLYAMYEKFVLNDSLNGASTMIILLCFFGGVQIFCLGIVGEYIGQVYREVKARPRYIIDKELL